MPKIVGGVAVGDALSQLDYSNALSGITSTGSAITAVIDNILL